MVRLVVLELYSGTKSFAKVAKAMGHEVFTVDFDPRLEPDLVADIGKLKVTDLPERFQHPDVVWASPPCQKFSVCRLGRNWELVDGQFVPRNEGAVQALELLHRTLELMEELRPTYWFIENPRAVMRKMDCMATLTRRTVTYCQYGYTTQKPTDIWTNCMAWVPRPLCKPRDPCHESAPRGSKSGIQGMANATVRGQVPAQLCQEILEACGSKGPRVIQTQIIQAVG